MGLNYTVVANEQVTEYLAPTKSRSVHQITAQADPSGVIFYARFVQEAYTTANIKRTLDGIADYLNDIANDAGVAGIAIEQDVDANGQVAEYAVVTVESRSGNSTEEIRGKQEWLFTRDTFNAKVAAARAKLDEIEAL